MAKILILLWVILCLASGFMRIKDLIRNSRDSKAGSRANDNHADRAIALLSNTIDSEFEADEGKPIKKVNISKSGAN